MILTDNKSIMACKVLVTAVSGASIGEQICKCLHLSLLQIELVTANICGNEAAQFVVNAAERVTLPRATDPSYLPHLLEIIGSRRIGFVIPGSEAELKVMVRNECRIRSVGATLLANSETVVSRCTDKHEFARFLEGEGLRGPRQWPSSGTADDIPRGMRFPLVIKPATGGGGSAMTFLAQDIDELNFFSEYVRKTGTESIVQEYVGRADEEYTVGVLHRADATFVGTVVLKRDILAGLSNRICVPNRTGRSELGPMLAISSGVTQGSIVSHPAVAAAARRLAERLGSRGPLNVQGRWTGLEFVAFEANPRFSGTSPMRAMAGFNEIDIMLRESLSASLAPPIRIRGGAFTRGLVEFAQWTGDVIEVDANAP